MVTLGKVDTEKTKKWCVKVEGMSKYSKSSHIHTKTFQQMRRMLYTTKMIEYQQFLDTFE